jgi:hypothetical protein
MKLRRARIAGQVAWMEAKNYAYLLLAGMHEEENPFVRPRPR